MIFLRGAGFDLGSVRVSGNAMWNGRQAARGFVPENKDHAVRSGSPKVASPKVTII